MKKVVLAVLAVAMLSNASMAQRKGWFGKKRNAVPAIDTLTVPAKRVVEVLNLIDHFYVQDPDNENVSEEAVRQMLKTLDPHSIYIPARDVQRTNEGLQGNFEGVGVSFQIADDTITVAGVIAGGPSEKVGVMIGDKVLRINGEKATGDTINNNFVYKRLRGKKGTVVTMDVLRQRDTMSFNITRDKIPINSIDSYFMADDTIGYIRLLRFSRTSVTEFRKALSDLQKQGMTSLILDLRGNGGGYLDIAWGLANEFLQRGQLVVYQEGRKQPRQEFRADGWGHFKKGGLVVLIDEGSASASEIVSGAVQDWDRGLVVGRRSFGKGLVQRMYQLSDGAQVRLTTARYFTPSGRCIQKPYDKGADVYGRDLDLRYKNGELLNADSIHFPDSLKYKTRNGRTVYGGGGIMPDVFVPIDTMKLSQYYLDLRSKGLLQKFPLHWADMHRTAPEANSFEDFMAASESLGLDEQLESYALEQGIKRDAEKESKEPDRTRRSNEYLHQMLKALVAKDLFGSEYYYRVMKDVDNGYLEAMTTLRVRPESTCTK